jgi:hypothetical protein
MIKEMILMTIFLNLILINWGGGNFYLKSFNFIYIHDTYN